jgi:hypothetical protein
MQGFAGSNAGQGSGQIEGNFNYFGGHGNMIGNNGSLPGVGLFNFFGGGLNGADKTPEKSRIATRLDGFNPKDNDVWRAITGKFGATLKQPELLSIARILSANANIKLDRDAKRRKSVLVKWFEENWSSISPFLEYVVLEDTRKP